MAVDDEKDILETLKTVLKPSYNVLSFTDPQDALAKIFSKNIDLVLLDIKMPSVDGISVLRKIKSIEPNPEVIMVTAMGDSKNATSAMKLGAYDYINKPFDVEELKEVIKKALDKRALLKENLAYKSSSESLETEIIGKSPVMKDLFETISKIAGTDSTVLITGETGSGKEMVAKAIHKNSRRANKPLVAVNCAAIPENLFESELFGHERGAFTGALDRRIGKFEFADNGTIFLDEIGCLPFPMQAKLLRILQDGEVCRVGSSEPISIDTRVICAANVDLLDLAKKGAFREDLYYRLNVIPVKAPSLRERGEDIILLFHYFLDRCNKKFSKNINGVTDEVLLALKKHPWTGNVRELENLVERLVVLAQGEKIDIVDLPAEFGKRGDFLNLSLDDANGQFEADYIRRALRITGGNQSKASEILKIDRTTLISKMKKYSIN